jgi:hypothetical protein
MRLSRAVALAAVLLLLSCQQANPPVVVQQTFSAAAGSTRVVAVMPFYPRPELTRYGAEIDVSPDDLANLVSGFVADALSAQGVRVIPPNDMALAFINQGRAVPRRDPRAAIEVAAREFGATSVGSGEVSRWRERKGEAYGAEQPASVGYQMSLHGAPDGRRLWSSRFDHTQRTLTADPLTARKYPGGGTRFLTAAELARWGAQAAAASLVQGQWRDSK